MDNLRKPAKKERTVNLSTLLHWVADARMLGGEDCQRSLSAAAGDPHDMSHAADACMRAYDTVMPIMFDPICQCMAQLSRGLGQLHDAAASVLEQCQY